MAIDPQTPSTLYAGTDGGGVFKSTNGGASWSAVNTGLTYNVVYALAIDPGTPSTLYAGTYYSGGVFKSTDGGASWSAANTGLTTRWVLALAIDPGTPSTLYAGTQSGGIFKSTNGGASWSAVNTGLTTLTVYALAIDPLTPSTLYAGTGAFGVFKSTNGGASWSAVNTGLTYPYVPALAIDPGTPSTLYAGTESGVFDLQQSGGGCPAVTALEGVSDQKTKLAVLYAFRDQVLARTATGQRYASLFYKHAVEGVWLMLRYPALRASSRQLLERYLPTLQALVAGRPVSLTRTDVAAMDTLLAAFAARASGGFKADLEAVRNDLRQPTVLREMGITVWGDR